MTAPEPEQSTEALIAEIERLLAKATPRPWAWDENGSFLWGPNGEMVMDRPSVNPEAYDTFALRMRGIGGKLPIPVNAKLVALLVSAAPRLLRELRECREALREMVERGEGCVTSQADCPPECCRYGRARKALEGGSRGE